MLQQQVQPQAPRFIKAPPPKASRMRLHIPSCIVEMHWRFVSNMCRCVWTVMHWSIIRVTTCQNSILPQTITWFHNVWTLMLKMLVQFIRWSGMMWNFDKRNQVYTHHMKLHIQWACLKGGSPTLFKKHAKLQRSKTSWSRQRWNPTLVTLRQLTLAHRQIQR